MKNIDKIYAEKLASEYAPKSEGKAVALKKLDEKVKRPPLIAALSFRFTIREIARLKKRSAIVGKTSAGGDNEK